MKIKLTILIGTIVVGGVAIYGVQSWASQPSQGISAQSDTVNSEVQGDSIALTDFSTTYFHTKLSSDLKVITNSESPQASILGQYLVVSKNPKQNAQLALTIGKASGGSVDDISAVKFRMISPRLYQQTISDAGYPEGSIVFTKKDGYEKSVFWLHDDKYASVVVSGGTDQKTALENIIRVAMQNWQWQ